MTIGISLLIALVGALVYALTEGKPSELGRIAFFCGLLVFLLNVGSASLSLLK